MSLHYMEKLTEIEELLNNPESSDIEILVVYIQCLSTHLKYCRPFFDPHPRLKDVIQWAQDYAKKSKENKQGEASTAPVASHTAAA